MLVVVKASSALWLAGASGLIFRLTPYNSSASCAFSLKPWRGYRFLLDVILKNFNSLFYFSRSFFFLIPREMFESRWFTWLPLSFKGQKDFGYVGKEMVSGYALMNCLFVVVYKASLYVHQHAFGARWSFSSWRYLRVTQQLIYISCLQLKRQAAESEATRRGLERARQEVMRQVTAIATEKDTLEREASEINLCCVRSLWKLNQSEIWARIARSVRVGLLGLGSRQGREFFF